MGKAKQKSTKKKGSANAVDEHVGQRLRMRRTLLGLTQEQLGDKIGLTFQQIQKYERGANRIGASRLYAISNALEVPPNFFFQDMPDQYEDKYAPGFAEGSLPEFEHNPFADRDTLKLVRAFHQIEDLKLRKQVLDLARSLAAAFEEEGEKS
jgi:transcriptional regulator with XRE-family HTH domain